MHRATLQRRQGELLFASCVLLLALALGQAHGQAGSASRAPVKVGTVQVAVVSSTGEQLVSGKGTQPSKLLSSPQITSKQTVEVTVQVIQPSAPQQVFLSFQRVGTDAAAYAVGKARKDGSGYSISAPASIIGAQIGKQAGAYLVTLLVGDPGASTSVSWVLGEVELVVEAGEAAGPGLAPRTATSQPFTNKQPVINHVFRPADKRPPPVVSLVFTGLAFVPLAGVVGYVLLGLGVNFKAWPRDGVTSVAALGFHGLVAAFLVVYWLFWTQWNLAQTLPVVLVLGGLLTLVGQRALSGIATERLALASKKA